MTAFETGPTRPVLRPLRDLVGAEPMAPGAPVPLADALAAAADAAVAPITGDETVGLDAAPGRVLAAPVDAPLPLPPFDRATMSGVAVNAAAGAPGGFALVGAVATGADPAELVPLAPGTAVRVATGAPVPAGADRVVPAEAIVAADGRVRVDALPPPGAHIRRRGAELAAGAAVLAAGRPLTARDLALVAALGLDRVVVRRRLRVALLAVGGELGVPGAPLAGGALFDATPTLLGALLTVPAIAVVDHGRSGDSPAAIEAGLKEAVAGADLVVVAGGLAAAGDPAALLARLGGRLVVDRAAMKPGKPVLLGRVGEVPVCGLPGNPVAAFVTFALLVRPLLARRCGTAPRQPLAMAVASGFTHRRTPGRTELVPVTLVTAGPRPRVERPAMVGAARLTALAAADGLAVVPHDRGDVTPGTPLGFVSFSELAGL
jgi:molybdopterin molybdotransferase